MVAVADYIEDKFTKRKFCAEFKQQFTDLDIDVKGIGSLELPITSTMARALIARGDLSHFGLGEKTVLDVEVRKSYEIPAEDITLGNVFQNTLKKGLAKVKEKLVLPKSAKLSASLHKLLIYDRGSFFKSHQDSEKSSGMFASLVVVLPSKFDGGELIIEYQGEKVALGSCETQSSSDLMFLAFYSDCFHSLQRVNKGYRVALTFNLSCVYPGNETAIVPDRLLMAHMKEYYDTDKRRDVLVYPLRHQYTKNSFSWQNLKGVDRDIAKLFKDSAVAIDYEVFIALADVREYWDLGEGARNYFVEPDYDEFELEDLVFKEVKLYDWRNAKDRKLLLKSKTFYDDFGGATGPYRPYSTEYTGFMGNYGNTVDFWYNRAAIVVWPRVQGFAKRYWIDEKRALKKVLELVAKGKPLGSSAYTQIKNNLFKSEECAELLFFAAKLGEEVFAEVIKKSPPQLFVQANYKKYVLPLLSAYPDTKFSALLRENLDLGDWEVGREKSAKLLPLFLGLIKRISKTHPATARSFAEIAYVYYSDSIDWEVISKSEFNSERIIGEMTNNLKVFVEILDLVSASELLNVAVGELYRKWKLDYCGLYRLLGAIPKIASFEVLKELREKAFSEILPLVEGVGSNYELKRNIPACSCDICKDLKRFLSSADKEKRWHIKEYGRQHIINELSHYTFVECTLIKKGRPYSLHLKKISDEIAKYRMQDLKLFEDLLLAAEHD